MPSSHRRFPLLDVTFAGVALPSATMDLWDDDSGVTRWSARALMPALQVAEKGRLTGRTKDGHYFSGEVDVANRQMGPGGPRGQTLVELHGSGPLEELSEPPPVEEPAASDTKSTS